MASRSKRHRETGDLLDRHPARANIFSPFVLADRAAFIVLALYFVFWPIWYVSEDKLSARAGDFRIEHLIVAVIFALSLGTLSRRWSRTPGSWALFLLVSYGAVTLIWSVNVKEGLLVVLNLTSVFVFAQILARNRLRQGIARLCFLVGLVLMTAVGLSRAEVPSVSDLRLLFPVGIDPNQFAVQIAMGVVILTAVAVSGFGSNRLRSARFWGSLTLGLLLGWCGRPLRFKNGNTRGDRRIRFCSLSSEGLVGQSSALEPSPGLDSCDSADRCPRSGAADGV